MHRKKIKWILYLILLEVSSSYIMKKKKKEKKRKEKRKIKRKKETLYCELLEGYSD